MALTQAQIEALYASVLNISTAELSADDNTTIAGFAAASAAGTSTDAEIQASIVNSTTAQQFVEPIIKLYQSVYGRQPDTDGLNFWSDALRNGEVTLTEVTTAFTASPEFTTLYPNTTDVSAYVNALYMNVLGRAADAAGQAFWQNSGLSIPELAAAFSQSAEFGTRTNAAIDSYLNARAAGTDVDTSMSIFDGAAGVPQVNGIVAVDGVTGEANDITGITISDTDSNNSTVTLMSANGGIINTTAVTGLNTDGDGTSTVTLTGTIANINTALAGLTFTSNATAGTSDSFTIMAMDSAGNSITKTVSVTLAGLQELTAAADTLTGTANADFFRANGDDFLQADDTITDATAGDNDVLSVDVVNGDTGAFTMSGIETVRVTDADDSGNITVDAENVTGVTMMENMTETNAVVTFDNVQSIDGLTVKISGASESTVLDTDLSDEDSDSLMVMLDKVTADASLDITESVGAGELETLTLMGSGNAVDDTTLSEITLATNAATAETIDASAIADGVWLSGLGVAEQTITLGAGNDMLNMGSNLSDDDTIDMGAGTDRLMLDDNTSITEATISNVEEIAFGAGVNNQTVNLADITGVTSTILMADIAGDLSYEFAAGASPMVILGQEGASADIGGNLALDSGNGSGDSAMIMLNDDSGITGNIAATTVETVTITGMGTAANAIGGTVGIAPTGTLNLVAEDAGSALTITGAVTAATVDATGMAGDVTLTGALAQATTYRGGEGVDTVTGSGDADVLVGGAGADVLDGGAGADVIGGGAGDDNITLGAEATDSYIEYASFAAVTTGEDDNSNKVIVNNATDVVQADIDAYTAAFTNSYLVVEDSASSLVEIYFDADWSDTDDREQIATLTGVTDATGLEVGDFGIYA